MEARRVSARWWWMAALAGGIGGVVYALYSMVAAAALGEGIWTPINLVASVFPALRPATERFDVGPTLIGAGLVLAACVAGGLLLGWAAAVLYPDVIRIYWASTILGLALGLIGGIVFTLWLGPAVIRPLKVPHDIFYFLIGSTLYALATHWTLTAFAQMAEFRVTFAPAAPVELDLRQHAGRRAKTAPARRKGERV